MSTPGDEGLSRQSLLEDWDAGKKWKLIQSCKKIFEKRCGYSQFDLDKNWKKRRGWMGRLL